MPTEDPDLTVEEREALSVPDIAALYRIGVHPVLLNQFCRALGYNRDQYRTLIGAPTTTARGVPWRTS